MMSKSYHDGVTLGDCGHHETLLFREIERWKNLLPPLISRILKWVRRKFLNRPRETSVDAVLVSILSTPQCVQVMNEGVDPRGRLEFVARMLRQSPIELLSSVASELNLACACTVNPVDPRVLPSGVTLDDYQRAGAIPIVSSGKVSGVLCVCPELLMRRLPQLRGASPVLALWSAILNAIDDSNAQANSHHGDFAKQDVALQREGALRVLRELMTQIGRYHRSRCTVEFGATKIGYTFDTAGGRRAYGELGRRFRPGLESLLTSLHEGGRVPELSAVLRVKRDRDTPARFHIDWSQSPHLAPSAPSVGCEAALTSPSDGACPYVLVVDDNECFGKVLEKFLQARGLQTTYVSSGVQAIDTVRQRSPAPDLILSDLHMPEMNGLQLLSELRRLPASAETPIIILTSDEGADIEARLIAQGADLFLSKTEDPQVLCAYVDRIVSRRDRKVA